MGKDVRTGAAARTARETLMKPNPLGSGEPPQARGNFLQIQELLGERLLALHWPTLDAHDRRTLLCRIDSLLRQYMDLKYGSCHNTKKQRS